MAIFTAAISDLYSFAKYISKITAMKRFPNFKRHSITGALVLLLCLLLLPFAPYAQSTEQASLPGTETHALYAKTNGQAYRIFVSLPDSYNKGDTVRYPVLYLLDGNPFFSLLQSMQRFFVTGEEVPEMIIVGIGYPVKGVMESMPYRTLDYTPTRDTAFDNMLTKELEMPITSGGAIAFLKTLKHDIFPLIEQRYKTAGGRGFAGHSFGALFGTYVLFHEPGLFSKYLLSSISMPWDNGEMLQEEQQYYNAGNRSLAVQVFMSVGSREEFGMQPLMHRLAASMRMHNYRGLVLSEHVLENETHTSAVTTSLNQGLRWLYGKAVKKG
jgi:predicted alpha/beta superfamily hydrolase